ncbi:MAG: hypothetical protein ACRDWA_06365, partial [Acidimicrobiia bacterium]
MTDYSAAAAALEVPEPLVRRSAEARAKADNVSVDELVAAWAGGGPAPAVSAPEGGSTGAAGEGGISAPSSEAAPEQSGEPAPAPAAPAAPSTPAPAPTPAPVRSGVPPVLVGAAQSTTTVIGGAVGLLLFSILIGFLVPSLPQQNNEVR